jgi:hypothetical protein
MNTFKKIRALFFGKFEDEIQLSDDTRRLDWMVANKARFSYSTNEEGVNEWFAVYITCPRTGEVARCDSPARNVRCAREAIDIAMGGLLT